MSRLKTNNLTPFSGQNINFGGHAIPSGNDKNLGSETNPWNEIYVSTGSVNFVGANNVTVASIKAGGETGVTGNIVGQIFTDTGNNNLRGSFSVGKNNRASGTASLAVGFVNTASGDYSLAQGFGNRAFGHQSFAQGNGNTASNLNTHAQGFGTIASGLYAHAEGVSTRALGDWSHAEGGSNVASNSGSHAEGQYTTSSGFYSHAEGFYSQTSGAYSHAEGIDTIALGYGSHTEGYRTRTDDDAWISHAEGAYTTASGWGSHAEGSGSVTQGRCSHAAGYRTIANGNLQFVVGQFNVANASQSAFIIGDGTDNNNRRNILFVSRSHFEVSASKTYLQGLPNTAQTNVLTYNPATGQVYYTSSVNVTGTTLPVDIQEDGVLIVSNPTFINFTGPGVSASANSTGINVHISGGGGGGTPAPSDTYIQYNSGSTFGAEQYFRYLYQSHSLQHGTSVIASGDYSHAQGNNTEALGDYSHAEGSKTTAQGSYSHAEGSDTKALGTGSHAGGFQTIASGSHQTAVGQWNAQNNTSSLFIVGAGISSGTRKDGFSVELDTANVRPHIVVPANSANPVNPKTGSMYFNPSTRLMYIHDGTTWRSASFA